MVNKVLGAILALVLFRVIGGLAFYLTVRGVAKKTLAAHAATPATPTSEDVTS